MYNLIIIPNNSPNFGVAHFNTFEAAEAAQKSVSEQVKVSHESLQPASALAQNQHNRKYLYAEVLVKDDYGTVISIPASHISFTSIVNVKGKGDAQIETKIDEARANKSFQERLGTNKELQLLSHFASAPQQPTIQMVQKEEDPKKPTKN